MGKMILSQSIPDIPIITESISIESISYSVIDVVFFYVFAIAIIAIITGIMHKILTRNSKDLYSKGIFSIMRDKFLDPSLSRFQFVLWTFVISFAYLSISLIRIFSGDSSIPDGIDIPASLLALMGISIAVPIASAKIYQKDKATREEIQHNAKQKITFENILRSRTGDNKFDLARFQMFLWTWLGIGVYLATFFISVEDHLIIQANHIVDPDNVILPFLTLPDIIPTLLVLMGLSQTAYIGAKVAAK